MDYKYTIKNIAVFYTRTPVKQVKNHVLKFGLKEGRYYRSYPWSTRCSN